MGKTYVLDQVATDLARGFTHPAIQRLSSLVAAYPTDLDLRRRLAAVHRRVGNRIQAGRWDYLTIGADTTDTSAFERAFPSAVARLRAMRWPGTEGTAPTSYARSRLARLAAAAKAEAGPAAGVGTETGVGAAAAAVSAGRKPPDLTRTWTHAVRQALRGHWSWLPGVVRATPALVRSWRAWSFLLLAGAVAAALVAVGAATVIEWIVL